ncbi:MAG: hypothetical protein MJ177_08845, partial [Clostridia bacterium]|nr:hypothetical protein [Clostridia bacterium]
MIIRFKKKYFVIICLLVTVCAAVAPAVQAKNDETVLYVIMYHQVSQSSKNTGKYVVSVAELEKDLIYLNEHGYHTVNTADLTEYVYHGVKLPEKPVL